MKQQLTREDGRAAVYGGAILGGGGGGWLDRGLARVDEIFDAGAPQLWSVDEFETDDLTATVGLVGAPAAPNPLYSAEHMMRTLDLLNGQLPNGRRLKGLYTNENGAETTINGWTQSATSGLPLVDFACNGRAHPTSVMGAMGLQDLADYRSIQAFAGGHPEDYMEGVIVGTLDGAASVVRRASEEAGGWVAVTRNPVELAYAVRNGAPGAISASIELGHVFSKNGVAGVVQHLGGEIVTTGTIAEYVSAPKSGVDVGLARLDDAEGTILRFVNEYMMLERAGERIATFPALIATFDEDGVPRCSAELRGGMSVSIVAAPAESLLLAPTMWMPELYSGLEDKLQLQFAPIAPIAPQHA